MGYTRIHEQPASRDPALAYEERGPGLYTDETAYALDGGEKVAVSVASRRLENGGGVVFQAWARWIEPDGTTKLDADGQEVETTFQHTADAGMVDNLTIPVIAKEMLLAVLGEPATTRELDGEKIPLVAWGNDLRLDVSIRNACRVAKETGPLALSAGSILD